MVPRALPVAPPVPPKTHRTQGVLREVDNQQQQQHPQPVFFMEFK
jgi:hypothetical protein